MRRLYKRKRAYSRKRTFKKYKKVARIGTVRRMISASEETKWRQVANDAVNSRYGGAGPDLLILNALEQGAGQAQRVGRQIAMTRLESSVLVVSRVNIYVRVRILIFMDKQANGVVPVNAASLFAGIGVLDAQTILNPLNPDLFPSRYTLLRDKTVGVGYENGPTPIAQERTIKFKIPLKKTKVQYTEAAGTLSTISKNVLYMVIISDEATTDNQPAVTVRSLLRYKDA